MKNSFLYKILFLVLSCLAISCQNDDGPIIYEEGTNEYTNQWMYEQMKKYYYWNESLPKKTDLALNPKDYFTGLLHPDDPYSYAIHPSLSETILKNLRKQFGFDISFVEYQGQVFGVVLYVLSDSPAEKSGLQRGHYITHINGTRLNGANFDGLYHDLISLDNVQLRTVTYTDESGFSSPHEIAIHQGFTFSQPIPHKIITEGTKRVGYIEVSHFDAGLAMLFMQVFQEFKNQSVNEVVVDLRYNGGGDVSSSAALSIILAPNIKSDDLFIQFEGNNNGGKVEQSFREALEMNEFQVSFESLRDIHPSIGKVYILCGNHTASASEIIINNLRPFINVITIGQKTVGKDVAGFPIEDDRMPGQKGWILYPSIYKLYNADNQGGYSSGIVPSIEADEFQQMEIFALGDVREALFSLALETMLQNGRKTNTKVPSKLYKLKTYPEAEPLKINL